MNLILFQSLTHFHLQKFPKNADSIIQEILLIKIGIFIIYAFLKLKKINKSYALINNHLVKKLLIIKKHYQNVAYCSVIGNKIHFLKFNKMIKALERVLKM